MKRMGKWLLGLVGLLVVAAGLFVAYFFVRYPNVPPAEDVRVAATPERLARGEYLVENVVGCVVCHAERDFDKYTGPVVDGHQGRGGPAVRLRPRAVRDLHEEHHARRASASGPTAS